MLIGLVTDTHLPRTIRDLWDEVRTIFDGVDLILHGGDIVSRGVLDWLEEIAPTLASRGNNDAGWTDSRLEDVQWTTILGWQIVMVHDMEPEERPISTLEERYLNGKHADIMITGHTHFERLVYREGVLQINSGSATHPHLWSTRLGTVGLLDVTAEKVAAKILRLGESLDLKNPAQELFVEIAKNDNNEVVTRRKKG